MCNVEEADRHMDYVGRLSLVAAHAARLPLAKGSRSSFFF